MFAEAVFARTHTDMHALTSRLTPFRRDKQREGKESSSEDADGDGFVSRGSEEGISLVASLSYPYAHPQQEKEGSPSDQRNDDDDADEPVVKQDSFLVRR